MVKTQNKHKCELTRKCLIGQECYIMKTTYINNQLRFLESWNLCKQNNSLSQLGYVTNNFFFYKVKVKPKKKTITWFLKKKKPKKRKKKSKHITHINNSDHTKQQRQKRKNFARCIGIPMGKVELAKFVRSKKSNGGSFSSHL